MESPPHAVHSRADDTTGAAIPIVRRVTNFKLVVDNDHFYQWVGIAQCIVINELHEVIYQAGGLVGLLWCCINHFAVKGIFQSSTWQFT